MNGDDELSLKDITFLRAIRDINGSPERFASTEQGATPATVTAITEATTLTEEEVEYRLDHPRLGKSGLVKVYEAGAPGDGSASRNSAELTKAGERAIAEAEAQEDADGHDWEPNETQSEFDDMQEWEPADVESDGAGASATPASGASAAARTGVEPTAASRTGTARRTNATSAATREPAEADDADRIAALEERIEQLEAESVGSQQSANQDHEQVAELAEEVSALRETTDQLASGLDEALDELAVIRDSEYGALDEKREEQFETAVKSMVAFHQLATEVLDVRVENYEPAAGRADDERIEITRNRIGDALGVGKSGDGGGGMTLDAIGDDDSDWPDPEEAARDGRVFSGDAEESDDEAADEPEPESDAPATGVYPPIGGDDDDSAREVADEETSEPASEAESDENGSDVPESGVYPPIGGDRDDEDSDGDRGENAESNNADNADDSNVPSAGVYPPIGEDETTETDDGSLPESIRPDTDASEGKITETAADEGHVVDPIRSTGDAENSADDLPLTPDAETTLAVRRAVVDGADEVSPDPWRLSGIDPTEALAVRDAVDSVTADDAASTSEYNDPYPDGKAYARIVDEASTDDARSEGDFPAVASTDDDPANVRIADEQGAEAAPTDDDD